MDRLPKRLGQPRRRPPGSATGPGDQIGDITCYIEGAYGPTILLVLTSVDGVSWLRAILDGLAESEVGTVLRLDSQSRVSIGAAVTELNLQLTDRSTGRHLVGDRTGAFTWSCTAEEWRTASQLIEPLLHEAGHQYLTSEVDDDALIEVSFGERHG
jgi:hypothetical protein